MVQLICAFVLVYAKAGFLMAWLKPHVGHLGVCKALFFLILGLKIFFKNIKVGGGKKNKK